MPTTSVKLPTGETITLTYWETRPSFLKFGALQSLRSGAMRPDSVLATQYLVMAPFYGRQFAAQIGGTWQTVVAPPSSNDLAKPYLSAILERSSAIDLTPRFTRAGAIRSSDDPSPTLAELAASIAYAPRSDESGLNSLLFIDDVFASGRTLAALLLHLRTSGLPANCTVHAAAPLWLPS